MKKAILLAVALAIPSLVFVFLKQFGRNEFEVPVFHEPVPQWTLPGCSEGRVDKFSFPDRRVAVLTTREGQQAVALQFRRLKKNFDGREYVIRAVPRDSIRCRVLLRDSDHEVLVDTAGRVRGYYDLMSREETDRLILEMKIVLKKY